MLRKKEREIMALIILIVLCLIAYIIMLVRKHKNKGTDYKTNVTVAAVQSVLWVFLTLVNFSDSSTYMKVIYVLMIVVSVTDLLTLLIKKKNI